MAIVVPLQTVQMSVPTPTPSSRENPKNTNYSAIATAQLTQS